MKKYFFYFSIWVLTNVVRCPQITAKDGTSNLKTVTPVKAYSLVTAQASEPVYASQLVGRNLILNSPKQNSVSNLTATVIMNDLNFKAASAGSSRDFLVTINEINNVSTQGTVTFRVFKPSAFSITYAITSGSASVYPVVAHSNGDWNFAETDNYITATSKSGVALSANSNKVVGFRITRKAGVPQNTQQNITVSIVASSGGEQESSDNITGAVVTTSETATPLVFTSFQLNPSGYTPLAAQLTFSASTTGKAFIRVRGKHGKLTYVEKTFADDGQQHSVPLIGLYPNYTNAVDVGVVSASGDTLAKGTMAVRTGVLSADIPLPSSIVTIPFNEADVAPGLLLVSSYSALGTGKPYVPYFLDAYGEIRWLLDYRTHPQLSTLNYEDGISRLRNGNFFFGNSTNSTIYEIDLLGNVLNNWPLSGYTFHHEVSEKPNGNFLLTANKVGISTEEDFVVEIDRQSKNLATVWDLRESLQISRYSVTNDGVQQADDWFHGNAVIYDSTDNTIVVSGRSQGVVKLDYTNNVKWILAAHRGWTTNGRGEDLRQFLLKPLDASGSPISATAVREGTAVASDFEWNWYQHNPTYMPNGDLLMFDNGSRREFDATPRTMYSRAVSYKIDPVNKTVQQTWAYGKERGTETYSRIVSSAQFLPQSNRIVFGPGYQVPNTNGLGGKIVEINYATKQVVSEISISSANGWGFHRTKKISAYP